MIRLLLFLFFVAGCGPDFSELSLSIINNFNKNSHEYNNILDLRNQCFNILSSSGLIGNEIFTAIKDNKIIGFITYQLRDNNNTAFIHDVCVGTNYRRMGLGTKFFSLVLKNLEKYKFKTLELEVYEDNLAARKIYERMGFMQVKKYKEHGRNILLMRKKI